MSILRKRGKEKLRFRIMDTRVTNKEFKYLKRLFLECLKENSDIEKQLDSYYKRIQVYFYYEQADPNVEKSMREFLKNPNVTRPAKPSPASTTSFEGLGCIVFFLKHLEDCTKKRKDIQNIEVYHKNGVFEELCHLVEQKGDSSIHPESYWMLWNFYRRTSRLKFGNEIIERLDTDRNHYEVYLMMIRAYPKEWVDRYWRYFMDKTPTIYKQDYEQWKQGVPIKIPIKIVYARLITDTLRSINALFVAEKVPREKLSNKHKKLLNNLIETGKVDIEKKKSLIERDMGYGALSLVESLDESIFKTSDIFFSAVLDLWKSLQLV